MMKKVKEKDEKNVFFFVNFFFMSVSVFWLIILLQNLTLTHVYKNKTFYLYSSVRPTRVNKIMKL